MGTAGFLIAFAVQLVCDATDGLLGWDQFADRLGMIGPPTRTTKPATVGDGDGDEVLVRFWLRLRSRVVLKGSVRQSIICI